MVSKFQKRLLEALVEKNFITANQFKILWQKSSQGEKSAEELILKDKIVDQEALTKVKSEILEVPYIDLLAEEVDPQALGVIPVKVSANYQMVSFAREGKLLKVALVNPQNFKALEAVEFLAKKKNFKIDYYLASPQAIQKVLKKYYGLGREVSEALAAAEEKFISPGEEIFEEASKGDIEEIIKSAPVSKIVSTIIRHAVEGGASDIHIEPGIDSSRVRYRVDGLLHTTLSLPNYIHPAIVSRIKVLASLKLDETRRPQDGRMKLEIGGHYIDFRISILPLIDNEKVVMRILDTAGKVDTLEDLGFRPHGIKIITKHIKKPWGLFLVTGPTGSGKTTTLYAALNILNQEGANIVTLEDPVEYYLTGINQSQVNTEVGFTFATGLRSVLRQDPNIIMVGEIRDEETAELAVHAGLTGHLVLSTLHTKDAFGAIPRLIDMKVQPFLIISTLSMVMSQRLVRRICRQCREVVKLPQELQAVVKKELAELPQSELTQELNSKKIENLTFYRGQGCSRCGLSGYQGRTCIAEIIEMTDNLANIIMAGSKIEDIEKEFLDQGMISMRQDGLLKALEGITTIEEVIRVTQE